MLKGAKCCTLVVELFNEGSGFSQQKKKGKEEERQRKAKQLQTPFLNEEKERCLNRFQDGQR